MDWVKKQSIENRDQIFSLKNYLGTTFSEGSCDFSKLIGDTCQELILKKQISISAPPNSSRQSSWTPESKCQDYLSHLKITQPHQSSHSHSIRMRIMYSPHSTAAARRKKGLLTRCFFFSPAHSHVWKQLLNPHPKMLRACLPARCSTEHHLVVTNRNLCF